MGFDEALEIPTKESATLALRTQQIIALESGVTRTADPLGGSYFLESLTDGIQEEAQELLTKIQDLGGSVHLIQDGVMQKWIAENAYQESQGLASGELPRVGVNVYVEEESMEPGALFETDPQSAERQRERLSAHIAQRDSVAVDASLRDVGASIDSQANVMPSLLAAARAGATVGEISDVMRTRFGEYREPVPW
jgi:methylmalonyl-CoA mutase N-terminal domain/subunit